MLHLKFLSVMDVSFDNSTTSSVLLADSCRKVYRGAGKSLARPGRKQATATEDFDVLYVRVSMHRDKLRIKQPTRCIKYPKFICISNLTLLGSGHQKPA
jgi:hypothetical protein